jgi:hypothetical protein
VESRDLGELRAGLSLDNISDLLEWSAKYPDDWRKTWQRLEDKWNKDPSRRRADPAEARPSR